MISIDLKDSLLGFLIIFRAGHDHKPVNLWCESLRSLDFFQDRCHCDGEQRIVTLALGSTKRVSTTEVNDVKSVL